jgi:hypothetical protein
MRLSLASKLRPAVLAGAVLAAAVAALVPAPARAWWVHGGWGWHGGVFIGVPPVVVGPPPVAYVPPPPPPPVYRPYGWHWVPGHYNWRGYWVPGHWARW